MSGCLGVAAWLVDKQGEPEGVVDRWCLSAEGNHREHFGDRSLI
jgi:hypothetical protein